MTNDEELLPFCECGKCGLRVTKLGNRFINGHNRQGKKNSPEHCAANSKAGLGVPKSPEHCAAMSAATLGVPKPPRTPEHSAAISAVHTGVPLSPEHSDAIKKGQEEAGVYDAMRGGNDIVNHHYIYDHNDLSKNTVQMTRSDHSRLHHLLKRLGYIVQHINVKEE